MKPEKLYLQAGVHEIEIVPLIEPLMKKNVVMIRCTDDNTDTIDLDGEWVEESESATYTFSKIEELDLFITKLQESREFLIADTIESDSKSRVG
jgi:hypothetical protein